MLLVIFLVDVTIIEGSADFRVARHSTSQSKVCEKYQKISSACRNCNTTVHCQVDNNGNWTETFSGYCPSNRKCVNGDCVFAERCPLPDTFFSCLTPGLYPDPADCFKYHICIKDGTKLIHYEVDCEGYRSYAFDPHTSICSDYSPVKGECNNYYVPVCKFPYEEGVIPNTSIYYQFELAIINGSVDYRITTRNIDDATICAKFKQNGLTCKNCSTVLHCQANGVNSWLATPAGSCPINKKCVNGQCVNAARCPFPDVKFTCLTVGMFPDPGNCTKYYVCVYVNSVLTPYEVNCEGNDVSLKYGYNPEKYSCSDVLPSNGQCQNYYVPICRYPYDVGIIPRTSIYYECKYYVDEQDNINLDILYPYQKRCDNGKIYNIATDQCRPLYYWEEKKVPYVKGVPIFGNMWEMITRKSSNAEITQKVYQAFPESRYVGMLNFTTPTLMIRDPDLLKQIFVKDFEVFPDHRPFIESDVDPVWSKNLFAMPGDQKWHEMRATLSPSFTSSKMRAMFVLMKECAKDFADYYEKQDGIVTAEFKDTFSRFCNDVIATTAFGVKCNSLEEPNNEFYLMGKEVTTFEGLRRIITMFIVFVPTISKILRVPLFTKKSVDFFENVVKQNIKIREKQKIVRPDMLHLLMEARKGRLTHESSSSIPDVGFAVVEESEITKNSKKRKTDITDEDITAQALLFFFGGFETMSTLFAYIAYELAINPDVQNKLQKEVDEVYEKLGGDVTYEALTNMKYMDCVVTETLRKWPPFIATNRRSVRDYKISAVATNETDLFLKKKSSLFIPIYAIHKDPKYYPNPEKFDPDRFNDENRKKIYPFTYIPFGGGPRSCIANRFALIKAKVLVAELVRKLEFVPVQKTQIPIKFSPTKIVPLPDEGIWLGIKKRNT
ncbi:hypothetical protein FQR65_LT06444 [Abscondita terminalis]|nr:hypothetical protein FQR65_LT06444 [Abscondita terminalis]